MEIAQGIELRTANEWREIAEATLRPARPLFGELWMEGDIAVLAGEPGVGKSVLVMQIAESIARGEGVAPFTPSGAGPQDVLYIDLETSPAQFRARYGPARADQDEVGERSERPAYQFSQRLHRACAASMDALQLEPLIERTGARVLVIDNFAQMLAHAVTRDASRAMRQLRVLREKYGLSILVVSHTSRIMARRGFAAGDIAYPSVMAAGADTIFALGRVRADVDQRYIKQIKAGADSMLFSADNTPVFKVGRGEVDFLSFDFVKYGIELDLICVSGSILSIDVHERAYELKKQGLSIRQIAEHLGLSRSTAHRMLHMPVAPRPQEYTPQPMRQLKPWNWFEGMEAFEEPRVRLFQEGLREPDPVKKQDLFLKSSIFEYAAIEARKEWQRTHESQHVLPWINHMRQTAQFANHWPADWNDLPNEGLPP